jgi:hypothetical protein
MKKYLFLDIDGVLVTHRSLIAEDRIDVFSLDDVAVTFINRVCYKYCVDIIISSCWKHQIKWLYKLLVETKLLYQLKDPINILNSFTPDLNNHIEKENDYWGMGLEIKTFLDNEGFDYEKDFAIIIDDDYSDLEYFNKDKRILLVTCDGRDGLSFKDMERIEDVLKKC